MIWMWHKPISFQVFQVSVPMPKHLCSFSNAVLTECVCVRKFDSTWKILTRLIHFYCAEPCKKKMVISHVPWHSWSILHVLICSYYVLRSTNKSKTVKARGILHTALTSPGAVFHFPESTFYFSFFMPFVSFPYGFLFVLCFNPALGSTLEWVCLCEMIGGWAPARDSWSLRNCLGVWNTLTATTLKVPWCSWTSQAAFDTPSSFNIMFDIWDVDIFLIASPEMNSFHLVIFSMSLQCIRIILTHGSVSHRQWHFSCWNCLFMLLLKTQSLSIPFSQSKYIIYQGLTEYAPEF